MLWEFQHPASMAMDGLLSCWFEKVSETSAVCTDLTGTSEIHVKKIGIILFAFQKSYNFSVLNLLSIFLSLFIKEH